MNTADETVQIRRINRRLVRFNQKLCTSRSYGDRQYLGRFYVIDTWRNIVIDFRITSLNDFEAGLPNHQICRVIS